MKAMNPRVPAWRSKPPEEVARIEKLYTWMRGYNISIRDVARQLGWTGATARNRLLDACPMEAKQQLIRLGFPENLLPRLAQPQGLSPIFPGLLKDNETGNQPESSLPRPGPAENAKVFP